MACETVTLPTGVTAIVCGTRRRRCQCGRPATLLCDWKLKRAGATCDTPLCARCTTSPAPGKDLCPKHADEFERADKREKWGEKWQMSLLPLMGL